MDVLLLPEFEPFLPLVDECGDFILDPETGKPLMPGEEYKLAPEDFGSGPEETDEQVLEEMRKQSDATLKVDTDRQKKIGLQ